jgi:hypothetical protein
MNYDGDEPSSSSDVRPSVRSAARLFVSTGRLPTVPDEWFGLGVVDDVDVGRRCSRTPVDRFSSVLSPPTSKSFSASSSTLQLSRLPLKCRN